MHVIQASSQASLCLHWSPQGDESANDDLSIVQSITCAIVRRIVQLQGLALFTTVSSLAAKSLAKVGLQILPCLVGLNFSVDRQTLLIPTVAEHSGWVVEPSGPCSHHRQYAIFQPFTVITSSTGLLEVFKSHCVFLRGLPLRQTLCERPEGNNNMQALQNFSNIFSTTILSQTYYDSSTCSLEHSESLTAGGGPGKSRRCICTLSPHFQGAFNSGSAAAGILMNTSAAMIQMMTG